MYFNNMKNWDGTRVLVTGADGFIGSHLAERLALDGAKVRAFCLYNSQGSLGWLDRIAREIRETMEVHLGDIRDGRFVQTACEDVEVIFHLAALIAIPYSYLAPESFFETNVRGTLNVLEGRQCWLAQAFFERAGLRTRHRTDLYRGRPPRRRLPGVAYPQ